MRKFLLARLIGGLALVVLVGCRDGMGEPIVPSTGTRVTEPVAVESGGVAGFFLLNEGNMGTNKASLDYFDYSTGVYHRNIFPERNPMTVRELGDVGNDLQIYGDRMYVVVNGSNLVRVLDVHTAREVASFEVRGGRHIVFGDDGHAYVSSFDGPVTPDGKSRFGTVVKVDLATLQMVGRCVVGRQPEGMVIVEGKLYVANSGGLTPSNYDDTVSVLDLATFTEIAKIEVAINLQRMALDPQGYVWVSSIGDYYGKGADTFVIDPLVDEVVAEVGVAASGMALYGEDMYVYGSEWSNQTAGSKISYAVVDTRTRSIVERSFIEDGTDREIDMPYCVAVNPDTGEIFVTDAKNYVTHGTLRCYSPDGVLKWSVTTGDIPAKIAFTKERLQPLK